MISLKNVSMKFHADTDREVCAVNNITLEIDTGQWFTVIGPNGSGKSTLLRLISGNILPTSGQVFLDGKDVTNRPYHMRASIVQHLEQDTDSNIVPSMTVEENLVLALRQSAFPKLCFALSKIRRERIANCLAAFEMNLESQLKKQIRLLSGGQQAAIVLARALLQDARVLLLDEVTASLDPHAAETILRTVIEAVDQNKVSVLMVTHDIGEALRCNRDALFMSEGKISAKLCAEELSTQRLRELYAEAIVGRVEKI
jgi:putative ABC transport system ATP-binding protein